MYKDLMNKINAYIRKREESIGKNIYEYQTTFNLLSYNLKKVKEIIENFDEISYYEKVELLEAIEEEFHIKHSDLEYDSVFHSRKKDDELAKNEALKVFANTMKELSKRLENVRIRIEYLSLQMFEFVPLLSLFDEETFTLKKIIDTKEKFDLLIRFLNTLSIPERNIYLNMINKDNLDLLIKRDQSLEEDLLEAKKQQALNRLRNQKRTKKEVQLQTATKTTALTNEEKNILDKAIQIIEENKSILENISNEASAGFEIISESNEHFYDLADSKTNLEIILLDINDLVRKSNIEYSKEIFNLLEQSFKWYDFYKQEVEKQMKIDETIKLFEEEHAEELDIIKALIKKYNKINNSLTKAENGFLISIENEYNNNELSEELREKNIMNICSGSRISITFYKKYKKMAEINDDYELYNMSSLETKKILLDEMMTLVDELNELEDTVELKPNEVGEKRRLNDVLYLTLPNGTFGVQDFIYSDIKDHYLGRIPQIERVLSKLETYDQDDIHTKTRTVKGQDLYKDKIRRVSSGQVRVTYISLNSLWSTNIPLDRPCYIVVSAGFKKGEKALYEYVNTQKMFNYVQDYIKRIQNELDVVRLQGDVQTADERVKRRFEEILKQNHLEFGKVLENMETDFKINEETLQEEGELSL